MKATPIPSAARSKVKERDRNRCARCGMPTATGEWHHRRSRSVRDDLTHSPANGVNLCKTCHGWVHANPFEARGTGFIVSRYSDPSEEPIEHALYGKVVLTDQGSWFEVTSG
jgi:5-methylcytosine-specific restriction protein A